MGLGEIAEKFTPEEDPGTSTDGGLSRVGISSRDTMRQGVDQPCWIRCSEGCRLALPPRRPPHTAPPAWAGWEGTGRWRRTLAGWLVRALPTSPPPPRGSFSPAPERAAAGGGVSGGGGGPCRGGWEGWQVGRERKVVS